MTDAPASPWHDHLRRIADEMDPREHKWREARDAELAEHRRWCERMNENTRDIR